MLPYAAVCWLLQQSKKLKYADVCGRMLTYADGWLLMQSKKLKKWQKRYFVLDNVALYYCRSPTRYPDGC
jgi:hypothetical protein